MGTQIVEVINTNHGICVITDSDPTIRTVRHCQGEDGYHRLKLPYVRMVMMMCPFPGINNVSWHGTLLTFGSLEPYENLQQLVFVLPMPNTDPNGVVHCCGMRINDQGSIERVATLIIEAYWSSVFSYWCGSGASSFYYVQGGLDTLKRFAKQAPQYSLETFLQRV